MGQSGVKRYKDLNLKTVVGLFADVARETPL